MDFISNPDFWEVVVAICGYALFGVSSLKYKAATKLLDVVTKGVSEHALDSKPHERNNILSRVHKEAVENNLLRKLDKYLVKRKHFVKKT